MGIFFKNFLVKTLAVLEQVFYNISALITEYANSLTTFFSVLAPHVKTVDNSGICISLISENAWRRMLEIKLKCPHENCGRCLGVFQTNDDKNSFCKLFTKPPKQTQSKENIFHSTCKRCKQEIYILMGFKN